ncbi:MAG: YfhO family protein [Candidatus Saganbacteria bacterium]|nr:YfhO family protein [Candidatus Saganbacteria bacterium]
MKKILVLAGFLALAALWFWQELFCNYLFCFSDLTFYFYPYRWLMTESVRQGSIPLWNPYLQLGFPFLATLQTGLFYPLSLFYFLFPFDRAFSWFIIVHFPLGAFFMYLLGREFKLSPLAAAGAGLTFAFSGYLISVLHMPTTLASVIWLPLIMLAWNRLLGVTGIDKDEQGGAGTNSILANPCSSLISLSLLFAIMFLGGEPTILYGTGWLLLGYLAYIKYGRWREIGRGVLLLAAACAAAAALTAAQLFPFLELLAHSSRSGGISFAQAGFFSLRPRELLELVYPYFFALSEYPYVSMSWLKLPYLGAVPAGLACCGLLFDRGRHTRWLLLALAVLLLIILGSHAPLPLYFWLYKLVPGFNLLRYPAKFLFLLVFVLSLLAGRGIDALGAEPARLKRLIVWLGGGLAVLFALYVFLSFNPAAALRLLAPLFDADFKQGLGRSVMMVTVPRDVANLGVLVFLLALFCGWLALYCFRRLPRRLFAAGLVALAAADLYTANAGVSLSLKAEEYRRRVPQNIKLLQADRSVFRFLASPDIFRSSHFELSGEYRDYGRSLEFARDRLTANQGMLYRLADASGYESILGGDQERLLKRLWGLDSLAGVRVLDLLNVKYLITGGEFPRRGFRLLTRRRDELKGGEFRLYRNERVLPRGFFVPAAVTVASQSAALDAIFRPGFEPRRAVVLEEKVDSPGGFWFTSEWYYPGWRAYVDGRPAPVYRADFMFRAVPVPPGFREVKFVYDPPIFKLGAAVSLLAWAGLIVAFSALIVYNQMNKFK